MAMNEIADHPMPVLFTENCLGALKPHRAEGFDVVVKQSSVNSHPTRFDPIRDWIQLRIANMCREIELQRLKIG